MAIPGTRQSRADCATYLSNAAQSGELLRELCAIATVAGAARRSPSARRYTFIDEMPTLPSGVECVVNVRSCGRTDGCLPEYQARARWRAHPARCGTRPESAAKQLRQSST